MNAVYTTIIIACWASIIIFWTVGLFGNKRTTSIPRSLKQFAINGFLVIGLILYDLVTIGPYRLVRHPIYSGLLLVALGFVFVNASIEGIIGLAGITITLILRIPEEESLITHAFPSVYYAYRARTKKLLPFVW